MRIIAFATMAVMCVEACKLADQSNVSEEALALAEAYEAELESFADMDDEDFYSEID